VRGHPRDRAAASGVAAREVLIRRGRGKAPACGAKARRAGNLGHARGPTSKLAARSRARHNRQSQLTINGDVIRIVTNRGRDGCPGEIRLSVFDAARRPWESRSTLPRAWSHVPVVL
jgi:hypothetical protein